MTGDLISIDVPTGETAHKTDNSLVPFGHLLGLSFFCCPPLSVGVCL